MVNENEFFRNATLKICGNLALEEALHATLLYLRGHLPIDALFAEYFDPDLGAARTIARADVSGGRELDMITMVPAEFRESCELMPSAALHKVAIFNHPEENPFAVTMLHYHGYDEQAVSLMNLKLLEKGDMFGGLVALAKHRDAFTETHARLLELLIEPLKIAMVNALQHRDLMRLKDRLADDNQYLYRELQRIAGDEIVGADFGLKSVMRMVRQAAPTESPILLTGETGVGKDVIANAIHLGSPRREGPFVPVNCGAIPATLIDSELFGHEKGAFTGALAMKRGRFERAHNGTILLDEIGEMPLEAQVRLLRVLQHREVERVGGTERIPVDIRIIAATNKDLSKMVSGGRFREDLWFRLNVFPIAVPPLRERRSDIPALVQHFTDRKAKELKIGETPRLAEGAIDVLMAYDWPGNVRELENIIERAMILHHGRPLRFDELGGSPQRRYEAAESKMDKPMPKLDTVIAQHISRALHLSGDKIHGPGGAGELLGVNPNTLRYKMKKLGIPFRKKKKNN